MPKKKPGMTNAEQSEAFKREGQRLIDAGELSPIEADAMLDRLVKNAAQKENSQAVKRKGS